MAYSFVEIGSMLATILGELLRLGLKDSNLRRQIQSMYVTGPSLYSIPSFSWYTDMVLGMSPFTVSREACHGFSQGINRLASPIAVSGSRISGLVALNVCFTRPARTSACNQPGDENQFCHKCPPERREVLGRCANGC